MLIYSVCPLSQAMLGVFFSVHSTVLIEDVPLTEEDVLPDPTPTQRIYSLYNQMSYNCFIAAAFYVLCGLVSCCQMRLNKQKKYLVH
ncbi:ribonuclease kappa-A [Brachyistius frenatus]|uniref:ribonuclease kappa-A n=1 Tax=Brachyistius frenatus TaxID=100188 RepID=UPI0037E70DEB